MLHIVYSKDKSTEFLSSIPLRLKEKFETKVSVLEIVQTSNQNTIHNYIEVVPANDLVLFLGHGSSFCLYGYEKEKIISKDHLHLFNSKNLFCFSCNSNELLRKNFKSTLIVKAVGFGDIPTDIDDIQAIQEQDSLAYGKIDDIVIEQFREIITALVHDSFSDYITRGLDFVGLCNYFSIRLNKKINELILNKSLNYKQLAGLLFQLKDEMCVF